jgi:hypothetical protein
LKYLWFFPREGGNTTRMKEIIRKLYMSDRPKFNKIKSTLAEPMMSMKDDEFLDS